MAKDRAEYQVGWQVWVVVKKSRHLVNVVMGQVVSRSESMICYANTAGLVAFAYPDDVCGTVGEAESRKKELEESQ